jgi:hypothetical protein
MLSADTDRPSQNLCQPMPATDASDSKPGCDQRDEVQNSPVAKGKDEVSLLDRVHAGGPRASAGVRQRCLYRHLAGASTSVGNP